MKIFTTLPLSLLLLIKAGSSPATTLKMTYNQLMIEDFVDGSEKNRVIEIYINAVVNGITEGLDNDARINMKIGNQINQLTKYQMVKWLMTTENKKQNCHCHETILHDNDEIKAVKIDIKHAQYTRSDVITVKRTHLGWKIARVEISFK